MEVSGPVMMAWVWLTLVTLARLSTAEEPHRDTEEALAALEALFLDSELPEETLSGGEFNPVPLWKFVKVSDGSRHLDLGRPQFSCSNVSLYVRLRLIRYSDLQLSDRRGLWSLPDKCGASVRNSGPWLLLKLPYHGCLVDNWVSNVTGINQVTMHYFDHLLLANVTAVATCQSPAEGRYWTPPMVRCRASAVTVKLPLGTNLQSIKPMGNNGVVGTVLTVRTTPDAEFVEIATAAHESFLEMIFLDPVGEMFIVLAACVKESTGAGKDRLRRAPDEPNLLDPWDFEVLPVRSHWSHGPRKTIDFDSIVETWDDPYSMFNGLQCTTTQSPGCPVSTTPSGCAAMTTMSSGCPATTTPSGCAATTTSPGCAATTTSPGCPATTTPSDCGAATTTSPGCAATTTSPGCPATTTPSDCGAATTTSPGCAATTTSPGCPATTTPSDCAAATTTSPGCAATTTSPGCPATTTPSDCGAATTTSPGCAATTTSPGCPATTTPSDCAAATTTSPGCAATTTSPGCPATTTPSDCAAATTTSPGCATTTTSPGCPAATTPSDCAGATTTSPGCAATTTSPGCPAATTPSDCAAATTTSPGCPATTTSPGCPAATTPSGCPATTTSPGCPATTTTPGCPAATTPSGCAATTTSPGCRATTSSSGCVATTMSGGCAQS